MNKIKTILALLLWAPPILLMALFTITRLFPPDYYHYAFTDKLYSFFLAPLLETFIDVAIFVSSVPYWVFLIIAFFVAKHKSQRNNVYIDIALIGDLIVLVIGGFFLTYCNADAFCRSEGSLTSGTGAILAIILGELYCTLPFVFFLNKISGVICRLRKKKQKLIEHVIFQASK